MRQVAAILFPAMTVLCILHHISWTKHDDTAKVRSIPHVLIVKDYNDTIHELFR